MNPAEYARLERYARAWKKFVFEDPSFDTLSDFGKMLSTRHVQDMEDWTKTEFASLYGLEVAENAYACLHQLVDERGNTLGSPRDLWVK